MSKYFICAVSRSNVAGFRQKEAIAYAIKEQLKNSWVGISVDENGYVMSDYPLTTVDANKVISATKGIVGSNSFFGGVIGIGPQYHEAQTQEKLFIDKRVVAVINPIQHQLGFGTIRGLEPNKYKRLRFLIDLDYSDFFKQQVAMYSDEVLMLNMNDEDVNILHIHERYMRNHRNLNFK